MKIKELKTERLYLRSLTKEDGQALKEFEDKNSDHLGPWETSSNDPIEKRLQGLLKDMEEGRSIRFLIFSKENPTGPIIGMCNFTQIFRGYFQACILGYKIDKDCEGKGFMFEALQATIRHMFHVENIHRIIANYVPRNLRSASVLKKLGFAIEGHAKDYLLINGVWEDHVLTSLTNKDWKKTT